MSKEVSIKITQQGAIGINHAWMVCESDDTKCISIDTASKYPLCQSISGEGELPMIWLTSDPGVALKLCEGHDPDSATEVIFPEYQDFDIFLCSDSGRYTINLVLIRKGCSNE